MASLGSSSLIANDANNGMVIDETLFVFPIFSIRSLVTFRVKYISYKLDYMAERKSFVQQVVDEI